MSAGAATIQTGTYRLSNHPDANQDPPPYGIRWDELSDVTAGNDVFTISFDEPGTNMLMTYDGSSLHIFGTGFGGRDVGTGYAADSFLGFYQIDFTFSVGVGLAPGDDDLIVIAPTGSNTGTITLPDATVVSIFDKETTGLGTPGSTFRFGDEDNDLGHRGFAGLSGWGWIEILGAENPSATRDFLFTAVLVPTPGATGLLGVAGLALLRRRRR
ncbi:MAG: hypothetical protein D6693_09595 [Planctomycetota bacterium]|nr:MAG: hypothetical protein D6693_09595 [Planctomycetota bacterium]